MSRRCCGLLPPSKADRIKRWDREDKCAHICREDKLFDLLVKAGKDAGNTAVHEIEMAAIGEEATPEELVSVAASCVERFMMPAFQEMFLEFDADKSSHLDASEVAALFRAYARWLSSESGVSALTQISSPNLYKILPKLTKSQYFEANYKVKTIVRVYVRKSNEAKANHPVHCMPSHTRGVSLWRRFS